MPSVPFVPFVKTAQLTAKYLLEGITCENVYHFTGAAEWDSTLLAALATAWISFESANLAAYRGNASELIEVAAIDLTVQDGQWDVSAAAVIGTRTSVLLPNNVSLAIKWITAHRGRSFRGRTYHIGLTEDMRAGSDTNSISTASGTNLLAAYRLILTHTWPNSGVLVIASRRHNNTWRTTGVSTPVTDCSKTDDFFDSMRRRLPAHNIHR